MIGIYNRTTLCFRKHFPPMPVSDDDCSAADCCISTCMDQGGPAHPHIETFLLVSQQKTKDWSCMPGCWTAKMRHNNGRWGRFHLCTASGTHPSSWYKAIGYYNCVNFMPSFLLAL